VGSLPAGLGGSLPVDAQGVTRAIDVLAQASGMSPEERRGLIRGHAHNPAVLHARVYGREPLSRETVLGSFVDGARVRADALSALADRIGEERLGAEVRGLLVEHPLPAFVVEADMTGDAIGALRAAYAAQERAAVRIAAWLDEPRPQ
jgi:hypothetical protein